MKSVDIDSVTVSVENTDSYSTDNRSIFEWTIQLEGETYSEADLKSGCGAEPSETEMLETLLAFLGAAAESYRYDGMEGENSHLFPEPVVKWASENLDEISARQYEIEEDLEQAKKARDAAYSWHGGQGSALYAFASSGVCENKEWLLREVRRRLAQYDDEVDELLALQDYIEAYLEFDFELDAWIASWYGA